jgi:hypothetical protein
MSLRSVGAAGVVAAVVMAGCGGGDSSQRLTPAQYRAKANAICRVAAKKAVPFPGQKSGTGLVTTAKLVTPYLEKTLSVERAALASFRALTAPKSHEAAAADLVDAQAGRIVDLQQALDSARQRDARGFLTAFQNDQKQDGPRYLKAARRLGLTDCVQPR